MIFILPVLSSFSRDAALVLVEVLLTLLGRMGGPRGLFAHASFRTGCAALAIDDIFPEILLPVDLTADGKLVRDFLIGVLGEGDGSNFLTGLEILVDLRPPEPDDLPDDLPDEGALGIVSVFSNLFDLS